MNLIKTLINHDFCVSMAEARRLVANGGVKINHEVVTDAKTEVFDGDFITTKKAHKPVSAPIETVVVTHGHNEGEEMTAEDAAAYILKGLSAGMNNFIITKGPVKTEAVYFDIRPNGNPNHVGNITVTIPIVVGK